MDDGKVSRRRYLRERRAREEAEHLLEEKSRALWEANEALKAQAAQLTEQLERAVQARTANLEQAKQAAESANEAKSAFLAMISHDIRTPLNGVLGMAAALEDTALSADQHEMTRLIQSSGRTLLGLLNDILDLSKIEARQLDIEAIPYDLSEVLDEVHGLFAAKAREKGLACPLSLRSGGGTLVRGDPTRLRQVLGNLLSNAIKFTETGEVATEARLADGQLVVRVSDTGAGVPAEGRARLFQAFAQADASITRKFGGSGLGLAISREVCRLLGGDLSYAPGDTGGSVFVATMALDLIEALPAQAGTGLVSRNLDVEAVLTARRWRVLAAEDNLTNQRVLELLLARYGFDLTIVVNGALAVDAYCANPFDLILMDVNMPVMDGLEAAAIIRVSETAHGWPRCPIIALSANAMAHQVADYLRQGIDAHVPKPIRRDDLAEAIARLLGARASETSEPRAPQSSSTW